MRNLLLLSCSVSLLTLFQGAAPPQSDSGITVENYKWSAARRVPEQLGSDYVGPVAAMTTYNKNFERNKRINDPAGAVDPNTQTTDGRAAALEKTVQDSRAPQAKPVDGFEYIFKVRNTSQKTANIMFLEYDFVDPKDAANVSRRQFLCSVTIKPGKDREVSAFSLAGPGDTIAASGTTVTNDAANQHGIVNRVEYTDGSIWQSKTWFNAEIKQSYLRAVSRPWGAEMCRAL